MAALLVTFGKLVCDEVLQLPARLVRGDQTHVTRRQYAGGAPANVAAWARGRPARADGRLGRGGRRRRRAARRARRAGVELGVRRHGVTPAVTVLVEPDGERTLLVDPGTAAALRPADVDPAWLSGVGVVHLDGYDLLPGRFPDTVATVADLEHARGVPVSADVAAAGRIRAHGPPAYRDLLARLAPDVLFCNAGEAAALDPADALAPLVVVHGGAGATRVGRRAFPVQPARVVDTTGAGDAFAAGFLAARLRGTDPDGTDLDGAVAAAHALAARAVGVVGAQPPPVGAPDRAVEDPPDMS